MLRIVVYPTTGTILDRIISEIWESNGMENVLDKVQNIYLDICSKQIAERSKFFFVLKIN